MKVIKENYARNVKMIMAYTITIFALSVMSQIYYTF